MARRRGRLADALGEAEPGERGGAGACQADVGGRVWVAVDGVDGWARCEGDDGGVRVRGRGG